MAGSTNFLQWNPGQNNQENDSDYLADSQRSGGAPNGTPFPSPTGNKLFYQLSTGITALMQMMATKGFTVNDTNIGTLASVLAAIQTTADVKKLLQSVAYSSSVVLNAGQYNGFQIALNGNLSFSITGATPGQLIIILFKNDSSGNHTVTFPGSWSGQFQPDPTPNAVSALLGVADSTGTSFKSIGTITSGAGVNNTPIGQTAPAAGSFTSLIATGDAEIKGSTKLDNGGQIVGTFSGNPTFTGTLDINKVTTTTPPDDDSSTTVPNTAWVQNMFSAMGFAFNPVASKGHIKLPSFLGGFIIQWGTVPMPGSSSSDNPTPFSFDIVFPNNIFVCVPGTFGD